MFKMLSGECTFYRDFEMSTNIKNILNENELAYQYNWYSETFANKIKNTTEDFFDKNFDVHLLGICRNINSLAQKDSYFVTKIKVDKTNDIFVRLSETAVKIILEKVLGKTSRKFDIENLTNFETKLLTTFNSCIFRSISTGFKEAVPALTQTNFNVVYLVFIIVDSTSKESARFVVTIPETILDIKKIEEKEEFPISVFEKSLIPVRLDIGKTTFSLHELKNIEIGDTVVFETSTIGLLNLKYLDYEKEVLLEQNPALIGSYDNNGGNNMTDKDINIWDSIEVEMLAHFDAVNITLGDLKKIQAGKVVELASIYENKVTLSVEDKTIAYGELVVINDKYGVKVTDVVVPTINTEVVPQAQKNVVPEKQNDNNSINEDNQDELPEIADTTGNEEPASEDEEFDYSDFDLEEDI